MTAKTQTQTQATKPAANAVTKARATAKPAAKATQAAKPAPLVFHVPSNRPSAGVQLFAYTAAAIRAILRAPKAKQAALAKIVHGPRAIAHHGPAGTGHIALSDKGVSYSSHFNTGAKAIDEKRAAVMDAQVDAWYTYIISGKMPEGYPYRVLACAAKVTVDQ